MEATRSKYRFTGTWTPWESKAVKEVPYVERGVGGVAAWASTAGGPALAATAGTPAARGAVAGRLNSAVIWVVALAAIGAPVGSVMACSVVLVRKPVWVSTG